MRFVELFAGIGGFSLGFERAGMKCVGHVEIEPYAQKVLLKHWPDVPLISDVKKVKGDEFGKVDLLCGGFPCQDISIAGNQKGLKDENGESTRSGLYDEIIRIAGVCRPRYIVLENVANLLSRADWFGYVLGKLAEIGYDAEWEIIRASEFGLPHSRSRLFIVAYPNGSRLESLDLQKPTRINPEESCRRELARAINEAIPANDYARDRGDYNGVPQIMDRLRCLGNSLVPQIAEYIGKQIIETEKQ
ncbi:MAG: DNA (cytosine-5-)-methyltransferase [Candidatus Scalindua sp.]